MKTLFDTASLQCARALPVKLIDSSRDLGWTSALVEYQQVLPSRDIFETLPTSDQTIVVMTHGAQEVEAWKDGAWRRASYRPGTVGMTPGGASDRLRRHVQPDAGPARKVNIYVPQVLLDEAVDHLGLSGAASARRRLCSLAHTDALLCQVALALWRAMREGASSLYVDCTVRWLTLHLVALPGGDATPCAGDEAGSAPMMDRRLKRALDYIEQHLGESLTVDRLAAEAAVSKFHFSRLFQQATGMTPHRWLTERRLLTARRLLEAGEVSIPKVAQACGFARPNHFSTQFSRRFGSSPGEYRRRA